MEKNLIGDGYRLGILGGGQLGRMIIQSAVSYDIDIHIMDLGMDAPCTKIASTYTDGDIRDYDQVMEFGKGLDTLTVEIENVNIQALKDLRNQGVNVYPQPEILEIIRDKGVQKQFYKDKGIPTSEFELFGADTPTEKYIPHLPFVHKLRSGGYDGKGVSIIRSEVDFNELFDAPSVVEEMVPFTKELSVIVARNKSGETAVYQTVECEFGSANLVEYLFSSGYFRRD